MEKSIPKELVYPQTVKIIERNGGEVGHQEIIFRNIQQVRPYLNTGATLVIFKSGEYVYYNERGTWNDVSASMTQSITRSDLPASLVALRHTRCQGQLCPKTGMNSAPRFPRDRGPPGQFRATQSL